MHLPTIGKAYASPRDMLREPDLEVGAHNKEILDRCDCSKTLLYKAISLQVRRCARQGTAYT